MLNPRSAFGPPPRVNIPPEFANPQALLQHLDMSMAELKKIYFFRHRMYHTFEISKIKGKTRSISAPDRRLKMVQRKLVALLDPLYRPRKPVHGFVVDRSIKSNAESHLDGRYLLNLDLKNFFPSISENRIIGLLRALGIDDDVSEVVARLSCNHNALPQGAPTSPVLSNMICFRLDKELMQIAKEARCIYTRYADDITFSSYQPLNGLFEAAVPSAGKVDPDLLSEKLRRVFSGNGFTINQEKTYYADRNSRQTVTGLRVNELINVDRRYVRNIRAALHIIAAKGVEEAQKQLVDKFKRKGAIGAHLHGKIAWLGHIKGKSDPIFRKLAARYNHHFPDSKIAIAPTPEQVLERAVWVIEHEDGEMAQGSAFFLRDVGLVTAFHCVEGSTKLELYHPTKHANTFPVKLQKFCADRDLAILSHNIPETEFYEVTLSTQPVAVGDAVTAAGYPDFGHGDRLSVRQGTVSSFPVKSAVPKIEVSQNLPSGMSGGPLMDDQGRVVGIVHKGGPETDRNLAIHRDALVALIKAP